MSAFGSGGSGPPPHGGGSGLSPFPAPTSPHAPLPAIATPPIGAGAMMHAPALPDAHGGAGAGFVPPVAGPAAPRNAVGLRPGVDDALIDMRTRTALAPHSGALFQDQHRKTQVSEYPNQDKAHEALIASVEGFVARADPEAPPSTLATAVHMASSQLHVSLPGPELGPAFTHGFPALAMPALGLPGNNGNLQRTSAVDALTSDIHERREHAKANVFEAAGQLSPMTRQQVALPSPRRESMAHGGGYIEPPPLELPPPALAPMDIAAQRQMARSLLTPLAEPEWTPPARGPGIPAAPQHGAAVNQARLGFMQQDAHTDEVGRDATAAYMAREVPTENQVRVNSVASATLHGNKKSGAHEVVPTELRHTIPTMGDHIRPQMAHAQADVRTSTALTFLRGGDPVVPVAHPHAVVAPAPVAVAHPLDAGPASSPPPTKKHKPGGPG